MGSIQCNAVFANLQFDIRKRECTTPLELLRRDVHGKPSNLVAVKRSNRTFKFRSDADCCTLIRAADTTKYGKTECEEWERRETRFEKAEALIRYKIHARSLNYP